MRQLRTVLPVLAPAVLVVATAIVGSFFERSTEIYFINALVSVSIVVALYVFVGNSGVLSFGHIAFVAVGAWTAGVLAVAVEEKPATMPSLFGFLSDISVGNVPSLLLAALVGGVFALVAGLPLMRLSGLAAGIATFAVLEITNNILRYYERIGPGLNVFSAVPETTDMQQAAIGALVAIGYASGLLGGALPTAQSQYLPSFLFGLVILTLLVRPEGLFTRGHGPVERV